MLYNVIYDYNFIQLGVSMTFFICHPACYLPLKFFLPTIKNNMVCRVSILYATYYKNLIVIGFIAKFQIEIPIKLI